MKLGDSMAPIEACSVWNDVCPRKTRPPKIGDIPRHVAVDEESPGCSTSRSLGQFNEAKPPKSMLERSTSCQSEHGRSNKGSGALPAIKDFLQSTVSTKNNEKKSQISGKIESKLAETIERSYIFDKTLAIGKTLNDSLPILSEFSKTLSAETRLKVLGKNPSLRVSRSTDVRDDNDEEEEDKSWEEDIPEGIFEVRKDSALYIDERNIESSTLRDTLLAVGVESHPARAFGSCNPRENNEEAENSRLSRPRRESSGYFSNLGTFDEDRWSSSPMDPGNQQDLIATRDISRERRRSSTKNRLPTCNEQQQQQSVQTAIGPPCGQQSTKIANLVYPTSAIEETPQYSSTSDFTQVTKMLRSEMPNIDEQMSLELDKSIKFEPTGNNETKKIHTEDYDARLMNKMSQLFLENSPLRKDHDVSTKVNTSNDDDKIHDPFVTNDKEETADFTRILSNKMDSPSQSSPRTSGRQRRRMMVHQYSSPNMTNTELERIIEKPYSETPDKRNTLSSRSEMDEKNRKLESSEGEEEIESKREIEDKEEVEAGDYDNEVVTARLGRRMSEKNLEDTMDARKLLPRSIKVYQLLSTQSEDRGDGEARLFDRRISLQITRHNEDETIRGSCNLAVPVPTEQCNLTSLTDDKKLVHADSVPILKISSTSDVASIESECCDGTIVGDDPSGTLRILSSPGELRFCAGERINVVDKPSGSAIPGIRPIYPYCPYSPYASPQGSPRTNRRRPLRESRRVSIDSRQGALQLNQYKLLNNIGQGSYGIVKLAYNEEDETHYAMKILSKKKLMKKAGIFGRIAPGRKGVSNPLAKVYREIALLKKLDHPNVVKLVEVLDDPDEDNLYLVFELVQKGEVLQLPTDKPLDEETARRHFRDVLMGVEYLHYQRIVHRDIKPSNLLVDSEGRVKVADLGVSAELRAAGELLSGSAGTPAFAAPETTTPGAQYSGTLCDVWSMGVTLYSLVTGKVPWDGAGSIVGVQAAVRSEQLRFPEKPCVSENLRDLISRMLAKDPAKRINLAEIKEDHWLTNDGREPLPNEADNCRLPVTVTDEEVARVVTRVPKLDTLILIKTMLKQHSFQNPFLSRRIVRTVGDAASSGSVKQQSSTDMTDSSTESISTGDTLKSKTELFHKAGRSNSAPDSYEWQINGRQISSDSLLPPVTESSSQEAEVEKR